MKSFASDNYSGVHPEVMEALQRANHEHMASYGGDDITGRTVKKFKALFGDQTEVFFVYNGTGANVLSLRSGTQSFNAVLCSELAHINVDESTAPEVFTGCKLIGIPTKDGKIYPDDVAKRIQRLGDQHHPQMKMISISQSTEYSTVYTLEEIRALSELARQHDFFLHVDGARISNAAVSLQKSFKEITVDAGVDVLSFGGTKNGLMFGEAVLVFNAKLVPYFHFIRKQGMQLHSKMRFISAQFEAYLTNELWKRNASHSNKMAKLLADGLRGLRGIQITQSVDGNGVFAIMPPHVITQLQHENFFYVWDKPTNEVRLMCSFDTTEEEVKRFTEKARKLAGT